MDSLRVARIKLEQDNFLAGRNSQGSSSNSGRTHTEIVQVAVHLTPERVAEEEEGNLDMITDSPLVTDPFPKHIKYPHICNRNTMPTICNNSNNNIHRQ
jgi:hypothetical protein